MANPECSGVPLKFLSSPLSEKNFLTHSFQSAKTLDKLAYYPPQSGKIEIDDKKPAKPAGFLIANKDFIPNLLYFNILQDILHVKPMFS
jgi:hypothetical protein